MRIIKNFYGFGKDGYEINGEMFDSLQKKPLSEDDLNYKDLVYIRNMNTIGLFGLGKRLDKKHYQTFYKKVEYGKRSGKLRKRYFEYKGQMCDIEELSKINGIKESTIYGRIMQRGWTVEKAVHHISPNFKKNILQ